MIDNISSIRWYIPDKRIREVFLKESWIKEAKIVEVIKRNPLRTIYRIVYEDSVFYLKHEHPKGFIPKIRSFLFKKAKKEFSCALFLKKEGIPTVPVIGWGHKGSESFLITEEIPGARLLKDIIPLFIKSEEKFLCLISKIADFLKLLVEKQIDHPDLHPGNILVKEDLSFFLVDLYKIRKSKKKDRIYRIFGWMLNILWPLDWEKIEEFLLRSGFSKKKDVKEDWKRLIRWKVRYVRKKVEKRKKKLLKKSSLCDVYHISDWEIFLKKEAGEKKEKEFLLRTYPDDVAEKKWINSYVLDFCGIPVLSCKLWLRAEKSIIFLERPSGILLREFMKWAKKDERKRIKDFLRKIKDWARLYGVSFSLKEAYVEEDYLFPLRVSP